MKDMLNNKFLIMVIKSVNYKIKGKLLLLIFSAVVLLTACESKQKELFTRNVKVTQPETLSASSSRSFIGIVKKSQNVNLGFKVPGQILKINVKEGDYINKGDVIAKLDDYDYKLQLSATEIQYQQVKSEIGRMEELYKRKSISGNDYEKAVAGLQQLEVQLNAYRNQVDYTVLKAPFSGYIRSVNYKESEMLDAGMVVVSLVDAENTLVEVEIPANLYFNRENIKSFTCRNASNPEKIFFLTVQNIVPQSNSNQLYKVSLSVDDKDAMELNAGLNVEVTVNVEDNNSAENVFVLPTSAVFRKDETDCVWLVKDNRVELQRVTTDGIDETGKIIIVSGLKKDDTIVAAGVDLLQENETVQILPQPTKTNVGGLL